MECVVFAKAINGHKIAIYGKATLSAIVLDIGNQIRKMSLLYHSIDMIKYNLILGIL